VRYGHARLQGEHAVSLRVRATAAGGLRRALLAELAAAGLPHPRLTAAARGGWVALTLAPPCADVPSALQHLLSGGSLGDLPRGAVAVATRDAATAAAALQAGCRVVALSLHAAHAAAEAAEAFAPGGGGGGSGGAPWVADAGDGGGAAGVLAALGALRLL
jgi:hypothetical protein